MDRDIGIFNTRSRQFPPEKAGLKIVNNNSYIVFSTTYSIAVSGGLDEN